MTKSRWDIGTYDLLINKDPEGESGDLMVMLFAHPTDFDDDEGYHDAPILAHIDVPRSFYSPDLPAHLAGMATMVTIGLRGLIQPESIEPLFGPQLGAHVMLALHQAGERDCRGMDMDHRPWRTPSEDAVLPLMTVTHALLEDLRRRGFSSP